MQKRANQHIKEGKNVIYDSTNINRKRRIHLIKHEVNADEYIAYYLSVPFLTCLQNDRARDRVVGYKVIDRMYQALHVPTINEGWNEVHLVNNSKGEQEKGRDGFEQVLLNTKNDYHLLFDELIYFNSDFELIDELPHDSTYHSFSVSRHTYYVYKYIKDNYRGERKLEMLYAAVFHDLGKEHCKSFYDYKGNEKSHASFIGHENVSSQYACDYLIKLGYDDDFIKYVVNLVQFHMMPIDMSEKQEKKLKGMLSNEEYKDLLFLHEADIQAK